MNVDRKRKRKKEKKRNKAKWNSRKGREDWITKRKMRKKEEKYDMQSNTQTAEKEGFANHNEIDYIARQSDFQVHTTPWYVLANLETPATFLLQGWTGAFSHKTRRGKERCNDQPVKCSRDTSRGVLRSLKGTFYGALLSNDRTIPWKTIKQFDTYSFQENQWHLCKKESRCNGIPSLLNVS